MSEVSDYMIRNYFSKYKGTDKSIVPTEDQIDLAYERHKDKFVIVRDEKIKGVGVFLTLSDETYAALNKINITDIDIINSLLEEHGNNIHFIILCADGLRTIICGIDEVKKRKNPKTISWWNPDFTRLHKYKVGG